MAKISEETKSRLTEYAKTYPSAVIIPIPPKDPILVLKNEITSLWFILGIRLEKNENGKVIISEEKLPGDDHFVTYWKERFYEDNFPSVFVKAYGSKLFKIMAKHNDYFSRPYPKGIFEIPLDAVLKRGIFQIDKAQLQVAKNTLNKKLLDDGRGEYPRTKTPDRKKFQIFIISLFKKREKKKPLPIKYLQQQWAREVTYDTQKIYSDSTIRRILKPFIKK